MPAGGTEEKSERAHGIAWRFQPGPIHAGRPGEIEAIGVAGHPSVGRLEGLDQEARMALMIVVERFLGG
jgi:hypothetical protein